MDNFYNDQSSYVPQPPINTTENIPAQNYEQPCNYLPEHDKYLKHLAKNRLFLLSNLIGVAQLVIILLGFALVNLFRFSTQSNYTEAIRSVFCSSLIILFCFILVALCSKSKLSNVVSAKPVKPGVMISLIFFSFLFICLGNLASNLVVYFFQNVDNPILRDSTPTPSNIYELFLQILYIAAIPALVEEFALRGVALGLLRPYGNVFAIVTTSILFALMHGNFVQIPFAFFVGIGLGTITVLSGSIWPGIIAHFINNALSVIISYISIGLDSSKINALNISTYGIWIILGVVGFILIFTKGINKNITPVQKPQKILSIGKRLCYFYLAPVFLVSSAIYIGLAIFYLK